MNNCKHNKCFVCGGFKLKPSYIGKVNLSDICSPKCQMASKDACECKCGGKFHKGSNNSKLNNILNPKKRAVKKTNKSTLKYLISKFEPENLTDEIAEYLANVKISRNSFIRFGDRNYIDAKLSRNWLSRNEKSGSKLDLLAMEFIDNTNRNNLDSQFIINEMIDFIVSNSSGVKQYIKDRNLEKKEDFEAYNIREDDSYIYIPEDYEFDYQEAPEDLFINGYKNKKMMKLKKGSAAAKAFMAKIRAKKGKTKKNVSGLSNGYKYFIDYMYQGIERTERFKTIPRKNKIQNGVYYVPNKFGEFLPLINIKTLMPIKKISGISNTKKTAAIKKTIVSKNIKPKTITTRFSQIISGLFDTKTINDLDGLKQEYRKLALIYHPDKGGSTAQFQELQAEYEKLRNKILSGSTLSEAEQENEIVIDDAIRAAINAIINLENINIQLIGKWVWVSGLTYPVRTVFSSAGFEPIKKAGTFYWVYKGVESKSRGGTDFDDIVKKYGSKPIKPKDGGNKKINGVQTVSITQKRKLKTALLKLKKAINKRPL